MSERWAVGYVDGDGNDDWQLLRNSRTEYFDTKEDAEEFAKKYHFKGKPEYWQPRIWKEASYETTSTHWREVR